MNTPWSLTFSEIGCGIIRDSTGEDICLVLQSGQQQTEPRMKEANLIAAAPEMYEALKECADVACAETCDHIFDPHAPIHTQECKRARAVLAKAVSK